MRDQAELLRKKCAAGQKMGDILRVSAAPGFSEHHTGRAIDVNTPGCEPLEECFDRTAAFQWLTNHGAEFAFKMTYPMNNQFDLNYEPWHWSCQVIE